MIDELRSALKSMYDWRIRDKLKHGVCDNYEDACKEAAEEIDRMSITEFMSEFLA
jgi:hypothetical protein